MVGGAREAVFPQHYPTQGFGQPTRAPRPFSATRNRQPILIVFIGLPPRKTSALLQAVGQRRHVLVPVRFAAWEVSVEHDRHLRLPLPRC